MLRFLSPEHRPLAKPISRISHLASRISHLASRISHLASRISHLASRKHKKNAQPKSCVL